MADSNHVRKLMEGVAAWNQWRSENPDVSIDLSGADLRDAELRGANLRKANLISCNLRDAGLDNADLLSANLRAVNLTGARLRAASLSGANITRATLTEVDASHAVFDEANLSNSQLVRAKLVGASLRNVTGKDANFSSAELIGSDLTRSDFRDSNFEHAQFTQASLVGADLRRCKLNSVSFESAKLSKAKLRHAHVGNADLSDANLTHADLREVLGLTCDQLTRAQDWAAAYRDAELACGAAIPDPDKSTDIEAPTTQIELTDRPPTVKVTGETDEALPVTAAKTVSVGTAEETDEALPVTAAKTVPVGTAEETDEALPVTAAKTVPVGTAEEIDEATRQRFNETPATVVAEARRAKDTTIALLAILRDMRLNSPEAKQAQALLEKQVNALDDIVAKLQSDGDKEAARITFRDLLYDVLESYLKVLANKAVTRGILAAAAIVLLGLAGVDVGNVVGALIAGTIVGIDPKALKKIVSEWKMKKGKGE